MAIRQSHAKKVLLAPSAVLLASLALPAAAQNVGVSANNGEMPSADGAYLASDTIAPAREAQAVVKKMTADPEVKKLLAQAKGVFIVPNYRRGSWGLGVLGGEGVMLAQSDCKWSNPVFYNLAGVSIGLQGGAEAGSLAMLFMNEKAVNAFMADNNFSLNAGTGLTLVNTTAKEQTSAGKGDVIVWGDTKGAFANATVGLTDIRRGENDIRAFYLRTVTAKEIFDGGVTSAQASALTQALPTAR